MEEIRDLKERLQEQRPASWENLPDIPLYMDQVLALMGRQTIHFGEEDALTAAMINNYIKDGAAPRAEGKRYNATHLAYLPVICVLKQVLSVKDVALLTRQGMAGGGVQENYDRFCAELSSALNSAADQLPADLEEDELAQTAMHFALLSYAYGLAGRRITEILRARETDGAPEEKRSRRSRRRAEKPETGDASPEEA